MKQFLRFCLAGTVGFGVDAGILQALVVWAHANPYIARIPSFLAAASVTWLINRRYTFESREQQTPAEWLRYVSLMAAGAFVNYGLYSLYIAYWDTLLLCPWLGVALGSVGALVLNFTSSRMLFRQVSAPGTVRHNHIGDQS